MERVLAFLGSATETAVVRNLTITGGNSGSLHGAGILSVNTTLIVENSTITGNGNDAIGASAVFGDKITLINSTVSGNKATSAFTFAAAIANELRLVNSTIAHNASAGVAGASGSGRCFCATP